LRENGIKVCKVLACQHGLFPVTQANMIPFHSYFDLPHNVEVISLYDGDYLVDRRKVEDLDVVFVDIQDVGARYYTYVWTVKFLAETGIDVVIFDRPNPLGNKKEGIVLKKEFFSFVGNEEIFNRHGMTIGQILSIYPNVKVIPHSFDESKDWEQNGLRWIPTSPNIPTLETAYFYVGFCLFEATNISEGRGTCYPFQVFGAPFIDEVKLKKRVEYYKQKYNIEGVEFLYHAFKPTFDKYRNQLCRGLKMVLTDKKKFHSIKTFLIVLKSIVDLYPDKFFFIDPPYEYEYSKIPIDILWGDDSLRKNIICNFDHLMDIVL